MGVIKFDRDFETLFNWDTDDNPTTEQDYQNAVKNWTETEKNIVDTLLWQPTTEYATGNIVKTPSLPSQYVLKCVEAGTSGSTEPSYSGASAGDTVTDGTVEWVIVSLATGNAADVDAGNIGVNAEVDNSEAWGNAIGGGAIAEDDGRLVKGDTVYAVTSVMETNIATNSEAIEDNAENIATNTGNIAQNTTDIDIAEKRIGNIEKLLQGNLYDYQTDSNSAYTKSVPSGAMPYASLDSIGGKTLVWNQLVYNGNFADGTDGWEKVGSNYPITISASDNALSVTVTGTPSNYYNLGVRSTSAHSYPFVQGHKYYFSLEAYSPYDVTITVTNNSTVGAGVSIVGSTGVNTWTKGAKILTSQGTGNYNPYFAPGTNWQSFQANDVYKIRNVMVCDLTLMFGRGSEPSTVAEFEAMFPASYYPYNAGTLLSAGVTEVKSVGINVWDEQWEVGGVNVTTGIKDGSTDRIRSKNFIPVQSGVSYYFNGLPTTENMVVLCYTHDKTYTGTYYYRNVNQSTQTLPQGTAFILFYMVAAYGTTYRNDICIHVSDASTNGKYYPYQENTYPIPAEIRSLEGYGWSAGTAYNYIDFERKVFVQNVGEVVLNGTQTKGYTQIDSVTCRVSYAVTNVKPFTNQNIVDNEIVSSYLLPERNTMGTTSGEAGIHRRADGSSQIMVCLGVGAVADFTEFNAYLADHPLTVHYALATPIETDISQYLTDDNLIEVEAGGSLTFPNSNGDDYRIPVLSSETFMVDLQSALGE